MDQSLFVVIMEAYLHGTSASKVDYLVKVLGTDTGISKSEVSRICADLDTKVSGLRDRRLAGMAFRHVFLDAHLPQGEGRSLGRFSGRGGRDRRRA